MQNIVTYVLGLQSGQFESGLARANGLTNNLEGSVRSLGTALGVTFGVAGIAMFTKSMIEAGSKVEDAQTGLTTLLRDSGAASQVIKNTLEDAQKTPFAFEGLLAANKTLISADETATGARTAVLNLANAIAATGGGDNELQRMVVNLQQVKNVGRASALDIKQFAYAGINIYKVLTEAGIKVGKDAGITYEQITYALQKAHDEGGIYFNGLENMANNTSVQISNLGDAYFQLKVAFFEELKPMIISFVSGLKDIIIWVKENHGAIGWLSNSVIGLGSAFKEVDSAMQNIFNSTNKATNSVVSFVNAFNPLTLALTSLNGIYNAMVNLGKLREDKLNNESLNADAQIERARIKDIIASNKNKTQSEVLALEEQRIKNNQAKNKALYELKNKEQSDFQDSNETGASNALIDIELKKISQESQKLATQLAEVEKFRNGGATATAGAKSAPITALTNKAKTAKTTAPKFDKAQGQKSITINVSIKDLIGTYNSTVTNVQGNATKIKEAVLGALTGAVNDFQIVAGQ